MAFAKKNKRKITVNNKIYYWSATGNDGWISLNIMPDIEEGSRLNCAFDYHHIYTECEHNGQKITSGSNQFVITPYIVEQAVKYALSIRWKPFEKGEQLNLGHIDDKIDLRLDKNRANNFKKD
jgi:hypothetical protein